MSGNIMLFVPLAAEIEHVRRRVDISSLTFSELVTQLVVGQFVILEGAPQRKYLLIQRADVFGFCGGLSVTISKAMKEGVQRLTSHDQYYDLDIRCQRSRCSVRDFAQEGQPTVDVDFKAFKKSVDQCVAEVYHMMLFMFPEIAARKDLDELRRALRVQRA